MAKRFAIGLLAAVLLFSATAVLAQVVTTGRLTGRVEDQTGAVIAGADIKVRDDATGAVIETKSGSDGSFTVANLKPGIYTVTVTSQGFKAAENRGVKIITGQVYDLVVRMEVGAVESTVVVEAGAEVLETASTTISTVITGKSLTQLPFTSRDALDLAILMPGASTTGRVRQTSFMGLPKGAINITFDGINAQDNILKSSDGFFTTIRPRVDSVEEVSVTTAAAGSDKASEGAVQINFETRRGGNQYTGSVWWYHRNDWLNSNYWFSNLAGQPRQRLRLNQFGYRIGGPIWKDKIFFFHAYDFYRKPDSILRTRTILTDAATNGVFDYRVTSIPSTLPPWVTCNATTLICSAQLLGTPTSFAANFGFTNTVDTAIASILSAVNSSVTAPGVTQTPTTSLFQRVINFNNSAGQKRYFPDFRFDWNVTKSHSVFAIYHYALFLSTPDTLNSRDFTYPVAPFNTNQASQNSNRNQLTFGWRWNLAANKSNEVRFGVVSAPISFFNDINSSIYPQFTTNLGALRVRPITNLVDQPFLPFGAFPRNTALGQIIDNFSWTKGKHSISMGFNMTQLRGGIQTNNAEVGTVNFGIASVDPVAVQISSTNFPGSSSTDRTNIAALYGMLAGRITSFSANVYLDVNQRQFVTGAPLFEKYRQLEWGLFINDSWRITPTLTLTAGLRWEYQGSPYDKNDVYFELVGGEAAAYGISGLNNLFKPGTLTGTVNTFRLKGDGSWYDAPLNNFAPSLGLAWQPNYDNKFWNVLFGGPGKTVFRAGFGTNFTREGTNNFLSIAEANPGYIGRQFANAGSSNNAATGTFLAGSVQFQTGALNFVAQSPSTFTTSFTINPAAGQSANTFVDKLHIPRVYSWQVGIQREITPNMVVEVRYVGNAGTRLWRQVSLNEVNIFENGFLTEFGIAQQNLAICRATPGCTVRFSNQGLPGQQNVPILTAAFTGSTTGSQTNANFASGTFITQLDNNLPGSMANSIWSSTTFFCNMAGQAALNGTCASVPTAPATSTFPENFWVVNPHARGNSFLFTNNGHSTYHSLQIEVRRRMAKGVQFNGNYTWSKSLSNLFADSSVSFAGYNTMRDPQYDKGPSPWDLRHQFKLNGIWELPFGPGRKWSSQYAWVNRLIEGWEFSYITRWQSGRVFNVQSGLGGTFNQNDPGVVLNGITPNQIQDLLSIRKLPTGQVFWFPASLIDSAGRANPTYIAPCRVSGQRCFRLFLYGPPHFRQDINVVKTTRITERINWQLRVEFLNAFNNINFFYPGSETTSVATVTTQTTAFGRVTNAYRDFSTTDDPGGRIIQIVLRVNF
jgi:hypothetical protein